jgi:hypothetical protein
VTSEEVAREGTQSEEAALAERLRSALGEWGRQDARVARGRHLNARCLIGIGTRTLIVAVKDGVPAVEPVPAPLASWDFALRGSCRAWSALWSDVPPPGWHDLFALAKRGELAVEGRLEPFMANLQYVKDLLASPRGRVGR